MAPKKKRRPTEEEKKKLDNSEVPNVTLRGAAREMSKGNFDEADRRWNLIKDKEKKKK
jgi:hypothetical protein